MREDLIGYLLGALEVDEMRRIEELLATDAGLRAQLEEAKRLLEPLDAGNHDPVEAPDHLIGETLDRINQHPRPAEPSCEASEPVDEAAWQPIDHEDDEANLLRVTPGSRRQATMRIASLDGREKPHRAGDALAAAIAAAILLGIALPGILRSRFDARRVACQDQLRHAGVALTAYAMRDPGEQLPQLAPEGPEAFAGIYAVRLGEAGLLHSLQPLWCPSLDPPEDPQFRVPSESMLAAAGPNRLVQMQRQSGGSYGYSLGVMDGPQYRSPRYEGRTNFALLGDVPTASLSQADPGPDRVTLAKAHGGIGANVLFEDGHVRFLALGESLPTHDNPFSNHLGLLEAGITVDDSALAPSWQPPFLKAKQR